MRAFEVNTSRDWTYHVRIEVSLYFRTYVTKLIISLKVSGYQTWGFTSYSIANGNQHSVIEFSFKTYVMYSGLSIYKSYDIDVRRE